MFWLVHLFGGQKRRDFDSSKGENVLQIFGVFSAVHGCSFISEYKMIGCGWLIFTGHKNTYLYNIYVCLALC